METKPFSETVTLRPAGAEDAPALSAFFRVAGGETDFLSFGTEDCPYDTDTCEQMIAEACGEGNLLLLAFAGEKLIGEVSLSTPSRKRFAHIRELGIAILADWCGQGLGTRLLREALAHAEETGARIVFLSCAEENARALHLYKKLGFVEYGCFPQQSYYGGVYHDTVYMVKYL